MILNGDEDLRSTRSHLLSDNPNIRPERDCWEITLERSVDAEAPWRARLLEQVRPTLMQRIKADPEASDVTLEGPLYRARLRRTSIQAHPGAAITLSFAPALPEAAVDAAHTPGPQLAGNGTRAPLSQKSAPMSPLPRLRLPDANTAELRKRLVGLDGIRDQLLLRWRCQWDAALAAPQLSGSLPPMPAASRLVLPSAFVEHMAIAGALAVFQGDPGVGKSALAKVVADTYCRARNVQGTILSLTTDARGSGLVGDFSQRLREAFSALSSLPAGELRVLLIDEADAVAVRRSEGQSHQEDRAATATILQSLDALAGQARIAVIMTTNLGDRLDPALKRRGTVFTFHRPDQAARRALLTGWLPGWQERDLSHAASCADGMTPADMERALTELWLTAYGTQAAPLPRAVCDALRQAERTQSV